MIETQARPERAYLLGVVLPGERLERTQEQMLELAELTRTAGGEVIATDVQRRQQVEPALFVGSGKVVEIKERRAELGYDLVICNEDLSPRQQRNLERELETRVVDRTELILDIFAQHARTREGRLQVESAQLHHLLPRLIGAWDYHRQGGGIGTRGGPGEQQIEVERRRIRKRLKDLDRELEQVRGQRQQQRASRHRSEIDTIAIVGYTNSGKSTLLNALTGARVRAENQLFATLDPTTRRLALPGGREVLVTDTVGFIQKLPTDLVAAFRATLEEVTYADAVLQVVDGSSPAAQEQAEAVDEVLVELGAAAKPRVVAVNKVDLLGPAGLRRVRQWFSDRYANVVPISALQQRGLQQLGAALHTLAEGDMVPLQLLVPYGRESVLRELRAVGGVERTEYTPAGTRALGRAPRAALHRFQSYLLV
ncbi:MAG: GTPase HflX [Candidatus Dormibacteraeota bacterium]|uniref:GTPase HflX n=1 Tax=Candidatus Dormiibacter inghamiae TaxID=3127013 RepID=A0A934KGB5_9BACT|nr:GTPase HflX [Candidatus Dormibacteraeota bacterium]MBJ7607413.1 GTPase HflX [Candidatus Dormibacteraeota bacterium]